MTSYKLPRLVARTVRIMQIIQEAGPLRVIQISRTTGIPYASSYRIVHALAEEGLVERIGDSRFQPAGRGTAWRREDDLNMRR
jgi:DNA-binding IclR family transcriptional regulator